MTINPSSSSCASSSTAMASFVLDNLLHTANQTQQVKHIHNVDPASIKALIESSSCHDNKKKEDIIASLQPLAYYLMEIITDDSSTAEDGGGSHGVESTTANKRARASSGEKQQQQQQIALASFPHPATKPSENVLSDPDLLTHMFTYLVKDDHASTVVLTEVACVSKKWKDFSRQDRFWAPITAALVPVAALDDGAIVKEKGCPDGYFGYLRDCGRSIACHHERAIPIISIDIWDARDGFHMYSCQGQMLEECGALGVNPEGLQELAPSFSIATRGATTVAPSMCLYITEVASLCMRVTLTCRRARRMVVLFESRGEKWELPFERYQTQDRHCGPLTSVWQQRPFMCPFFRIERVSRERRQEGTSLHNELWRVKGHCYQIASMLGPICSVGLEVKSEGGDPIDDVVGYVGALTMTCNH